MALTLGAAPILHAHQYSGAVADQCGSGCLCSCCGAEEAEPVEALAERCGCNFERSETPTEPPLDLQFDTRVGTRDQGLEPVPVPIWSSQIADTQSVRSELRIPCSSHGPPIYISISSFLI